MRLFARIAALAIVISLLILAMTACGSSEGTPTPEPTIETAPTVLIGPSPESSPATTSTVATSEVSPCAEEDPSATAEAAESELFQDFPDYPGSKNEDPSRFQSSAPFGPGNYSKVEWQAYLTGDPTDRVRHFYKTELPKLGWEETIWMPASGDETEDIAWCVFLKNGDQSVAGVLIGHDQGRTYIVVMRGEGKN